MFGGLSSRGKIRPSHAGDGVTIVPIGSVEGSILDFLSDGLSKVFGKKVQKGSSLERASYAYNEERGQYLAEAILLKLAQVRDVVSGRVLGVIGDALYRRDGRTVFSHADRERRVAVVSIKRLQDEYYGLPSNVEKLQERVLKEAIQQLGRTYGLKGCMNPLCAMFDTNQLLDLDIKQPSFCSTCRRVIP